MGWSSEGCYLEDWPVWLAVKEIKKRVAGCDDLKENTISRCVAVWYKGELAAVMMTCMFGGVASFHGYKFIKGEVFRELRLARNYIEVENLKYSAYHTDGTKAILKRLGFKEIGFTNNCHVVKREG